MFESAFRSIDNSLRTDSGCSSVLDYIEQTSWLLFLKYLDDYEQELASQAVLEGRAYSPLMDERYRWRNWAAQQEHRRSHTPLCLPNHRDQSLMQWAWTRGTSDGS
jgi:type I restriction enzyme M protein